MEDEGNTPLAFVHGEDSGSEYSLGRCIVLNMYEYT